MGDRDVIKESNDEDWQKSDDIMKALEEGVVSITDTISSSDIDCLVATIFISPLQRCLSTRFVKSSMS